MLPREKYINPFTDFGFKKLFGSAFNKELLIDFLNQVLAEREQIHELTYLNTETQGERLRTERRFLTFTVKMTEVTGSSLNSRI